MDVSDPDRQRKTTSDEADACFLAQQKFVVDGPSPLTRATSEPAPWDGLLNSQALIDAITGGDESDASGDSGDDDHYESLRSAARRKERTFSDHSDADAELWRAAEPPGGTVELSARPASPRPPLPPSPPRPPIVGFESPRLSPVSDDDDDDGQDAGAGGPCVDGYGCRQRFLSLSELQVIEGAEERGDGGAVPCGCTGDMLVYLRDVFLRHASPAPPTKAVPVTKAQVVAKAVVA